MNATSGEVLREVLLGLLIMEPNVKRSKIRRRCLEMKTKWFCAWVPCADYSREGKKERERETNRKAPSTKSTKYGNKKVRMHEQCMSM